MKHIESYINKTIQNPQNLPKNISYLLKTLEEYDNNDEYFLVYFDKLDDLSILVKNAIAAKAMTTSDWLLLEEKYWKYANEVFKKESSHEYL